MIGRPSGRPGERPSAIDAHEVDTLSAAAFGEDIAAALEFARDLGTRLPQPGSGGTWQRWTALADVARVNLTAARVLEAHADALAILAEAGQSDRATRGSAWGVFAAEDPRHRLDARPAGAAGFVLDGTKPWCSLGGDLDAALVTAWNGDERQLFRVDLRQHGVTAHPAERWVARGLRTVVSVPVSFDAVPADPVGAPGWYLRRPGFARGGIGVAACWYGGALGLGDTLTTALATRPGDLPALHLGVVDAALAAARAVLVEAAREIDGGSVERPDVLALRVRAVVADSVERVLAQVARALGPAPLAFDAAHAARVADLQLYVRQHHGERDWVALGDAVRTRR